MRLFRRRFSEPKAPLPPGQTTLTTTSRIDWKRAVPRLLALALIIAVLVLGVVWLVSGLTDDKPKAPTKKQPAIAQPAKPAKEQGTSKVASVADRAASSEASQPAQPANNASSSTASQTATSAGTPAASSATSAQSGLTDTGPGETAALFIIATAAGSMAYQVNLRRRLN